MDPFNLQLRLGHNDCLLRKQGIPVQCTMNLLGKFDGLAGFEIRYAYHASQLLFRVCIEQLYREQTSLTI